VLSLLAGALAPRLGHAQSARRIPRVGVLWHAGSAEEEAPYLEALLAGFRSLGYDDGRTIALDHRFPNEEPAKFERMAIELVATKPDILLAANVSSALALQKAT
jgi:putative ABC transport system substrate-binding protein